MMNSTHAQATLPPISAVLNGLTRTANGAAAHPKHQTFTAPTAYHYSSSQLPPVKPPTNPMPRYEQQQQRQQQQMHMHAPQGSRLVSMATARPVLPPTGHFQGYTTPFSTSVTTTPLNGDHPAVAELQGRPKRRRANNNQLGELELVFQRTFYPSTAERLELAHKLGMTPRRVQIWFQNQRQKIARVEGGEPDTAKSDDDVSVKNTANRTGVQLPTTPTSESHDDNDGADEDMSDEGIGSDSSMSITFNQADEPSRAHHLEASVAINSVASLLSNPSSAANDADSESDSDSEHFYQTNAGLPMKREHLRRKGKKPVVVYRPIVRFPKVTTTLPTLSAVRQHPYAMPSPYRSFARSPMLPSPHMASPYSRPSPLLTPPLSASPSKGYSPLNMANVAAAASASAPVTVVMSSGCGSPATHPSALQQTLPNTAGSPIYRQHQQHQQQKQQHSWHSTASANAAYRIRSHSSPLEMNDYRQRVVVNSHPSNSQGRFTTSPAHATYTYPQATAMKLQSQVGSPFSSPQMPSPMLRRSPLAMTPPRSYSPAQGTPIAAHLPQQSYLTGGDRTSYVHAKTAPRPMLTLQHGQRSPAVQDRHNISPIRLPKPLARPFTASMQTFPGSVWH